nr:unnamed protein product [Callosobruchus chinensis]
MPSPFLNELSTILFSNLPRPSPVGKEEIEEKVRYLISHFAREVKKEQDSKKSGSGTEECYKMLLAIELGCVASFVVSIRSVLLAAELAFNVDSIGVTDDATELYCGVWLVELELTLKDDGRGFGVDMGP